MKKTAEFVSLGHPDKTADFISSYILDRMIEQDPRVKYAVEVMVKDNEVILGGEVKGNVDFNLADLWDWTYAALAKIGYTQKYSDLWGVNAINPLKVHVTNLIGKQSGDINQGVEADGWGDQGVFVGYACKGDGKVSRELYLARKLNHALYEMAKLSDNFGIDIKTQITMNDIGGVETAIVAIPMLKEEDLRSFVISVLGEEPENIIINGTGRYVVHSSIADCGITGRKLACDFYSTTCAVGGGSPWTKDASKADVSLNILARKLAVENLDGAHECWVYLSSCIGRVDLPSVEVVRKTGMVIGFRDVKIGKPSEIIEELGLNKPVFADLCARGITEVYK